MTVGLSKAWHQDVSVYWSTEEVSADEEDYQAAEQLQELLFSPGETRKTIKVRTTDDEMHEITSRSA